MITITELLLITTVITDTIRVLFPLNFLVIFFPTQNVLHLNIVSGLKLQGFIVF